MLGFEKICFILATMFLGLKAANQWTKLATISSLSFEYGTYTDAKGIAHLVYCKHASDTGGASLFYTQILPDGSISKENEIYKGDDCRSTSLAGDTTNLYVTFSDARLCGPKAYACANIQFTESKDGGATWSKPFNVHPSSSEPLFRYNPIIVTNEIGGRLWIAYKSRPKEDPSDIMIVSRPPGSAIFSAPVKINKIQRLSMIPGSFGLAIMKNKGNFVLHIIWQDRDFATEYLNSIIYSRSSDNGNVWEEPKIIGKTNLLDSVNPLSVASMSGDSADLQRLFIIFSRTDSANKGVWMKQSKDNGITWAKEVLMNNQEEHLGVYGKICSVENKLHVYMLLQDQILEKSKNAFGYWTIDTEEIVWKGNPYGNEIADCFLPKIVCGSGKVIKICKVENHKNNNELVYQFT